jgi:hypothetical protein
MKISVVWNFQRIAYLFQWLHRNRLYLQSLKINDHLFNWRSVFMVPYPFLHQKNMQKFLVIIVTFLLSSLISWSQKMDTIRITPELVNTKVLIPGTHRWLVYFKMGADSPRTMFNIWTRNIQKTSYNGKEGIEVSQEWEDKDGIMHTTRSVSDAKDFRTLYHTSWWKQRGSSTFDFLKAEAIVNEKVITQADTSVRLRRTREAFEEAVPQYTLNWHLDLEVFPLLPYRNHVTFLINFYDPGFSAPKWVAYTVTGSAKLPGLNGEQVDCWLLEHHETNNKETFFISKKTKEVLKLEQQFGKMYRYKIKLPFSN